MDFTKSLFPPEIIENILKFADGPTLLQAELVCNDWKNIIEYIDEKYNIWKKCYKDIPKIEFYSMKEKYGCTENENQSKIILHNWLLWQKLKHRNYQITRIELKVKKFHTSIKVSGDVIITGTMTGQIIFFKQKDMSEIVYETNYSSYVEDLQCLNAIPYYGTGFQHTHLLIFYTGRLVFLTLGKNICTIASIPEVSLYRVFKNVVCYVNHMGQVFVSLMHFDNVEGMSIENVSTAKVYAPTIIKSLCIYANKISLVTDNYLMLFDYTMARVATAKNGQMLPFYNALVERYWTFRNEIIFATTSRHLHFAIMRSKKVFHGQVNVMEILGSSICDIYLHGYVLIITMSNGLVYIYYVKKWSQFRVANYDAKILAHTDAICGIDVQELKNEQKLFLCTAENIVHISFPNELIKY
ncbi:hypothetical protein CBL_02017 [Carabus blaptoides fortunei]